MNCATQIAYNNSQDIPILRTERLLKSFRSVDVSQGDLTLATLRNSSIHVTDSALYIHSDYLFEPDYCYRLAFSTLDNNSFHIYPRMARFRVNEHLWKVVMASSSRTLNKEFQNDPEERPTYCELFDRFDESNVYGTLAEITLSFPESDRDASILFYTHIFNKRPVVETNLSNNGSNKKADILCESNPTSTHSTPTTGVAANTGAKALKSFDLVSTARMTEIKDLTTLRDNAKALIAMANSIKSTLILARRNELVRQQPYLMQQRQAAARILTDRNRRNGISAPPTLNEIDVYVDSCEEQRRASGQLTKGEMTIAKAEDVLREIYGDDFDFETSSTQVEGQPLSVVSKDTFKGKKSQFFMEMAREIASVLVATSHRAAQNTGTNALVLFTLPEAFAIYNRSRGLNTVSPSEFNKAVDAMAGMTYEESPLAKYILKSTNVAIVVDKNYSIDKIGKDIVKTLHKRAAEDSAARRPMSGVAPSQLGSILGIANLSSGLAKELLIEMERERYLCRASNVAGMTFFLNLFDGSRWKEVMRE